MSSPLYVDIVVSGKEVREVNDEMSVCVCRDDLCSFFEEESLYGGILNTRSPKPAIPAIIESAESPRSLEPSS